MIDKEFAVNILKQYKEKPTLINEIDSVEEAVWLDESLEMAIQTLMEDKWIPCSERLPNENVDVLIVKEIPDGTDDGRMRRIEIASYGPLYPMSSEKGWISNYFTRIDKTEVIFWMPLPSLFGGDDK